MSVPKVTMPLCAKCRKVSVLSPCRECATPAELEAYPKLENRESA